MTIKVNKFVFGPWLIFSCGLIMASCGSDDPNPVQLQANYFVGIEVGEPNAGAEVLSRATSLEEGEISPVNNGFQQPSWTVFLQGIDQIFTINQTSAVEVTSYEIVDSVLTKGSSFFVNIELVAGTIVDESTAVLIGSARSGFSAKQIFLADTDEMRVVRTVESDFGNLQEEGLIAWPTDVQVQGSDMFVTYYLITADGNFSTPQSNEARVAVFSYPELEFEKIISDDRTPNLGRFYGTNALEVDENGDIYTYASSSLACGFAPIPETNSGVLRIKNGETEFDEDYHIDFETLSNGYKLHDLYYVSDGKAVVRVLKEDETNPAFLWATYTPLTPQPLLETGILDLYNESFTLLENVPKSGGGWNGSYLVEDDKLFMGIHSSDYAGIYMVDTNSGTATEGATIAGNYAKGILSLQSTN